MTHTYSLAYLTANGLDPVASVALAAELGFDHISFRLLPTGPGDTPPPLMTDDTLIAQVIAAMRDTGVTMSDAEMIRLNDTTDVDRFRPFLDRIKSMGARHILVAGDDPDRIRITDTYGKLCHLVADYGMTADLEFMPWTAVKNIADARAMVEAVAHPAAAILVDSLHFDRCGSTLEELSNLPRSMMNYVQICDGPAPYDPSDAAMMNVARTARLLPGDGGIDLKAFAQCLPADMPISVEVPNVNMAQEIGVPTLVRRALERTKGLFENLAL